MDMLSKLMLMRSSLLSGTLKINLDFKYNMKYSNLRSNDEEFFDKFRSIGEGKFWQIVYH